MQDQRVQKEIRVQPVLMDLRENRDHQDTQVKMERKVP